MKLVEAESDSDRCTLVEHGRRGVWIAGQALVAMALIGLVVWALGYGVQLRQQLFAKTETIRFRGDIGNAFGQGNNVLADARRIAAAREGGDGEVGWGDFLRAWHGRYDEVARPREGRRPWMDYVPARLLIMSLWTWHVRTAYPETRQWNDAHLEPLLRFNALLEFTAAVGMFLLVWIWVRRGQRGRSLGPPPQTVWAELRRVLGHWKPWLLGLAGAMLLWFNLATMWNAHAWPQWDTWVVPFYVWAAVLASVGWWFGAGALIALGCMFKGQILLAAPVLVLWPLFSGNVGGAVRVALGFAAGLTAITSSWLVNGATAWVWVSGVAVLAGVVWGMQRQRWYGRGIWAGGAVLAGWMVWPWMGWEYLKYLPAAALLGLLLAAPPGLIRRTGVGYFAATLIACAIALAYIRYEGSLNWYTIGLQQGTHQYENTTHRGPVNNLASILGMVYRWTLQHPVEFEVVGLEVQVESLQRFLRMIYGAGLVLCAIGLAVQSRRGSPRAVLALAAPWVVLFAVLGQMHERYFVWAAALSAAGVAVGFGPVLLHMLITALATGMMANSMLRFDRSFAPEWQTMLNGMHPHIGWVVVLLAGIYLYLSLAPGKSKTETEYPVMRPVRG